MTDEEYVWSVTQKEAPRAIRMRELVEESRKDETLKKVKEAMQNDSCTPEQRHYEICRNELCFSNDVLLRGTKIVPPMSLRQRMIELGHEGHPGIGMMRGRMRQKLWWPKMMEAIEHHVKACNDCQMVGRLNPPEPMIRHQIPNGPWQEVAIDIMGPLPWGISLLVIVDYYSRYYEVESLKHTTSEEVISKLSTIFARWGIPNRMISDNGPQFTSQEFENFCESKGIDLRHSTPYWPRMNGEVERQNGSLKKILQSKAI